MQGTFRFSFGPWNIHEGADPFGPEVRKTVPFNKKLEAYKKMASTASSFTTTTRFRIWRNSPPPRSSRRPES